MWKGALGLGAIGTLLCAYYLSKFAQPVWTARERSKANGKMGSSKQGKIIHDFPDDSEKAQASIAEVTASQSRRRQIVQHHSLERADVAPPDIVPAESSSVADVPAESSSVADLHSTILKMTQLQDFSKASIETFKIVAGDINTDACDMRCENIALMFAGDDGDLNADAEKLLKRAITLVAGEDKRMTASEVGQLETLTKAFADSHGKLQPREATDLVKTIVIFAGKDGKLDDDELQALVGFVKAFAGSDQVMDESERNALMQVLRQGFRFDKDATVVLREVVDAYKGGTNGGLENLNTDLTKVDTNGDLDVDKDELQEFIKVGYDLTKLFPSGKVVQGEVTTFSDLLGPLEHWSKEPLVNEND